MAINTTKSVSYDTQRFAEEAGMGDIPCQQDNQLSVGRLSNLPNLTYESPSLATTACFMGPRGSNFDLAKDLAETAVNNIHDYRKTALLHMLDFKDAGHDLSCDEMKTRFDKLLNLMTS